MCRIAGIYRYPQVFAEQDVLLEMQAVLEHGGPDASGIFEDTHIAICHRRLSILDLSDRGSQPMERGDWLISYNGEIYNFEEIKSGLEDYDFLSTSDTEVLLHAFDKYGLQALSKCRGMFALALWHKKEKCLYLTRDRLGIKPLYYYHKDNLTLFASEIKAFFKHPEFDKSIDKEAIADYLRYGYFRKNTSVFKYVRKVSPGTWLKIREGQIEYEPWYELQVPAADTILDISESEVLRLTEEKIKNAAQSRLIADVPVGLFLSGGTDSALLAALLASTQKDTLDTFTIGVDKAEFNESKQAAAIAKKLGLRNHLLYCTPADFREIVELLPDIYDEPFGDSSAIPMCLLSRFAGNELKVCLSGDGGDELFGGYAKYAATYSYYPRIKGLQFLLKKMNSRNSLHLTDIISSFSEVLAGKYSKMMRAAGAKTNADFFEKASTYLSDNDLFSLHENASIIDVPDTIPDKNLLSVLGYLDLKNFTEGDILTKTDRASMQHGLEVRTPYLEHTLVEFALSLPNHLKISGNGKSKYLTKKLLEKYLPPSLIYTPKRGFSIPVLTWLKEDYAEDLRRIGNDTPFHKICGLKTEGVRRLIHSFLHKRYLPQGFVVWFIFCLYRWYLRWQKI